MRPGQNKRMRGRNRRGPNPLTRSFESNGPDVKVRGTAQHITEKYVQLARDAHVSGDPVAAESYLQHAEHYYRIIAAAHLAQQAAIGNPSEERDDGDDDDFDTTNDRFTFRAPQSAQQGQAGGQPGEFGDQPGFEGEGEERPERSQERSFERPQGDRNPHRRNDRNDRNFRPRHEGPRHEGPRNDGPRNEPRGDNPPERNFDRNRNRRPNAPHLQAQPGLEAAEQPILPAFLTAPVRPISQPVDVPADEPVTFQDGDAGEVRAGPFRARRRRRPRGEEGGEGEAPAAITAE